MTNELKKLDSETAKTLQTLMLVIIESNKLMIKAKFKDATDDDKRMDLIKAYSKIYQNVLDDDSRLWVSKMIGESMRGEQQD